MVQWAWTGGGNLGKPIRWEMQQQTRWLYSARLRYIQRMWLIQKHRPNPIPACGWFSQPSSIGVYLCSGLARFQPETYKTGDSTRKLSSRWFCSGCTHRCMNPTTFGGINILLPTILVFIRVPSFWGIAAYPNMQLPRKDGMTGTCPVWSEMAKWGCEDHLSTKSVEIIHIYKTNTVQKQRPRPIIWWQVL